MYRIAMILCLFSGLVFAQTTSTISGTISTTDGSTLPGVVVKARSEALVAGEMSTVSGSNGAYRFPSLPPGTYRIEAVMTGFNTVFRNVRLGLGQKLEVNLSMNAALSETITVTESKVPLKTMGNEVGQNYSSVELNRLPVTHEVNDLINYAPGINGDRAYGSTGEGANGFNLDGVDVSDPGTGEHWMLPHMDWVQEIQITGLGANAEYGGYTGAMYNIVTRSGGNELSGSATLYYSGGSLVDENSPADNAELTPATLERDLDIALSVGGPIVKNKIWYFVSAQQAEKEEVPLGAERAQESRLERYLLKVTAQPNVNTRLTALVDYDGKESDYRGIGRDVLADAATFQDSPNLSYNLTMDWISGNQGLLTVKVSGFTGEDDRLSAKGLNVPGRTDFESGLASENATYTRLQDKRRLGLNADYTMFLDDVFGGDSHALKFGVSLARSRHVEQRLRNGGFTYVDDSYPLDILGNAEDLADYLNNPLDFAFSSDRGNEINLNSVLQTRAAYIQDAVEWDHFSLQAGLRFTQYEAGFQDGNKSVYEDDVVAPRLGFSWEPGKGNTVIKGHVGRYYESVFAYLYDREVSGGAFEGVNYFDYNGDPDNPAWDIPAGGRDATLATLDPNIEHPYVDQMLFTVEHTFGDNMLLGVDLISRKSRNIIAMINTNDDYDVQTAAGNPLGGDLPLYDLLSSPDYLLTNPDEAYRDYEAVMLRYERRHRDGWMLRGSLVWSDLEGNAYALDSYVDEWADLNGQTLSNGTLPGFSEWEFKLTGSVDLPLRFQLGGHYRFLSGEHWTPTVRYRGLFRNDRQTVFLTPRGSRQLPDRQTLDLKLARSFVLVEGLKLDCYLDVFNVFNEDTVLDIDERWGTYYYDWENPSAGEWVDRSAFEEVLRIEAPREIRFGSRLKF